MSIRVTTSAQKGLTGTSNRVANLVRWIFFSALIGVVPIIYTGLNVLLHRQSLDLQAVLAHSDLILVSIVLLADAIGDLVSDDKVKKPFKVLMSGSSCCILVVSCLLFASISLADSQKIDKNFVTIYSFMSFSWIIIIDSICKWVIEE